MVEFGDNFSELKSDKKARNSVGNIIMIPNKRISKTQQVSFNNQQAI